MSDADRIEDALGVTRCTAPGLSVILSWGSGGEVTLAPGVYVLDRVVYLPGNNRIIGQELATLSPVTNA